jgi:hypothetical protein
MSHQESLELIEAANRRMAERAKAPAWYHWALGLMIGGLCAVQAAGLPWIIVAYVVFLAGFAYLIRAYRRHTGMWIPGYRAGRTRWVAFGSAAIVAVVFLASAWMARRTGQMGWYLGGGALIAILATARGYAWEKAYRRDLGVE